MWIMMKFMINLLGIKCNIFLLLLLVSWLVNNAQIKVSRTRHGCWKVLRAIEQLLFEILFTVYLVFNELYRKCSATCLIPMWSRPLSGSTTLKWKASRWTYLCTSRCMPAFNVRYRISGRNSSNAMIDTLPYLKKLWPCLSRNLKTMHWTKYDIHLKTNVLTF